MVQNVEIAKAISMYMAHRKNKQTVVVVTDFPNPVIIAVSPYKEVV